MKNSLQIFRFLLDAASRGEQTALITITGTSGGSPRAPGTHMAVSENGTHLGSLSSGCVEAAIIGEAKRVIESGRAEQLRLGVGSPFFDIRLPCGGAIDILITPAPEFESLQEACAWLAARRPVALLLGQYGSLEARPALPDDHSSWHRDAYLARHDPDMRLLIAGHGAETLALVRLSLSYGAEVAVLSPGQDLIDAAGRLGAETTKLRARQCSPHLCADRHTAVVFLFHDHDWELELLVEALEQEAFFIGAMGSRTTQARRLAALAQRGVPLAARARLIGPIGLIGSARDPDTLALSVMAQIVSQYYNGTAVKQFATA